MSECQTKAGNQITLLSLSHSRTLVILNNFCFHVYAQKSLSHSLILKPSHSLNVSLSLSHSFALSFTHSPHAEQLLFSCLCSKVTLTISHSLILNLSHSHTLSISHSFTLDMLNNFCLHVYAQNSLFIIVENCNVYFLTSSASSPSPVTLDVKELVPS